jgi:hypothetical protein
LPLKFCPCVRLTSSHTGAYLAERTAECLETYRIEGDTLGFTMDNASNNDKMLDKIESLLPSSSMSGRTTQVRCFGHILNLAAKAFLSVFNKPIKARKRKGSNDNEDPEDDHDENENEGDEPDDEDNDDEDDDGDGWRLW